MLPRDYFDRFETPKYRNRNPVQRYLIESFVGRVHSMFVGAGPFTRVLEVGVGEGFLSGHLSEKFPEREFAGVDLSADDIARLRPKFPRIQAFVGNIYDLRNVVTPPYDLVMCCEVLEHVDDPARALASLDSVGASRFILSVPHEPYFMLSNLARGKNIARLGNDPEHIQHFGKRTFRNLLESRFDVLALEAPYPWLLALCAARGTDRTRPVSSSRRADAA